MPAQNPGVSGYANQVYTVEFTIPGNLDGSTLGPAIDVPDSDNVDPQQIYRPEVPDNLGLIDVDYVVEASGDERLGARGCRVVHVVWIESPVTLDPAGGAIQVVDNVDGTFTAQRTIDLIPAGAAQFYRDRPFIVPQGSMLRVFGFTNPGPGTIKVRLTIQYCEDITAAQAAICACEDGGAGATGATGPAGPTGAAGGGATGAATWAETLVAGAPSGGTNPILTDGDVFQGEDLDQPISAGVLALRGGNNPTGPGGNAVTTGGSGGTNGGDVISQAGSGTSEGGDVLALAFDDGTHGVRTQTTGFEETIDERKTFAASVAVAPSSNVDVLTVGTIAVDGRNLKLRLEVTARLDGDDDEVNSSVLWQTFWRASGTVTALTSHFSTPDFQSNGLIFNTLTFIFVISGNDIILRMVNGSGDEFVTAFVSVRWARQVGGIES